LLHRVARSDTTSRIANFGQRTAMDVFGRFELRNNRITGRYGKAPSRRLSRRGVGSHAAESSALKMLKAISKSGSMPRSHLANWATIRPAAMLAQ
jgi:hypothetical protein